MGFLAQTFPDCCAPLDPDVDRRPPKWSTGIVGCVEETNVQTIFYAGWLPTAVVCPPLVYGLNRKRMLELAPGERLFMCDGNPWSLSDEYHAVLFALWCIMCPPCMSATARGRIRAHFNFPGTYTQDFCYHMFCSPCALAQETRQLKNGYSGPKEVKLPQWRLCMTCCVPMEEQNSAIFEAVKEDDEKMLRHLAAHGGNVNSLDKDCTSPLMVASVLGHRKVVNTLIELGANVHHADRIEQTAMHRAAMKGFPEVCMDLWKAGGLPDRRDSFGKRPLDYASGETREVLLSVLGVEDKKVLTRDDILRSSGMRIKGARREPEDAV